MTKVIFIIVAVLVILEQLYLIYRNLRPHGMLHIDEYLDKDVYRMLYFVPLEDLKKHRRLRLKVEVQKWESDSEDYMEDYE